MKRKYWLILIISSTLSFGALFLGRELKIFITLTTKNRYWKASSYDISKMRMTEESVFRFNKNFTYERYIFRSDSSSLSKLPQHNKSFKIWNNNLFLNPIEANGKVIMDGRPIIHLSKDSVVFISIGKNVWADNLRDSTFKGKNHLYKKLIYLSPFNFSDYKIKEYESSH